MGVVGKRGESRVRGRGRDGGTRAFSSRPENSGCTPVLHGPRASLVDRDPDLRHFIAGYRAKRLSFMCIRRM